MKSNPDQSAPPDQPARSADRLFWISASVLLLIAIGLFGLVIYDGWQQQNQEEVLEMIISPQDSGRELASGEAIPSPTSMAMQESTTPVLTPTQEAEATSNLPLVPGDATPRSEPPGAGLEVIGGQYLTSTELKDDFSTALLGWSEAEREGSRRGYLPEGQYYIEVSAPGVFALSFLPVEFLPGSVEFTAQVPEGSTGGTYGVLCQYGDENNFYLVEVNPATGKLAIGERIQGNYAPLTDPEWQPLSSYSQEAGEANRLGISCSSTEIVVVVNGQAAARQLVPNPIPAGTRLAMFAAGYEGVGENGFRVILDDVIARAVSEEGFR